MSLARWLVAGPLVGRWRREHPRNPPSLCGAVRLNAQPSGQPRQRFGERKPEHPWQGLQSVAGRQCGTLSETTLAMNRSPHRDVGEGGNQNVDPPAGRHCFEFFDAGRLVVMRLVHCAAPVWVWLWSSPHCWSMNRCNSAAGYKTRCPILSGRIGPRGWVLANSVRLDSESTAASSRRPQQRQSGGADSVARVGAWVGHTDSAEGGKGSRLTRVTKRVDNAES